MDSTQTSLYMDLLHHDEIDRLVKMADIMMECLRDPGVREHTAPPPAPPMEEQDQDDLLITDLGSPQYQMLNTPGATNILFTFVPPTFYLPSSTPARPTCIPAPPKPSAPPSAPPDPKPYVKKPPNAFMVFRMEQRPLVVAQRKVKDCAIVNKILGQMWNSLSATEKEEYYRLARIESQRHYELHPTWKPNRKVKKVKTSRP